MSSRKKILEQIVNNFHIIKNKMYGRVIKSKANNAITHSQWFVLCIIERNTDFGIKEISHILSISSSAATQLVNSLVKNGYVARQTDAKDRRALNLVLSKKGQQQIKAMKKKQMQFAQIFFKVLTQKELEQYVKLQNKILSNIT